MSATQAPHAPARPRSTHPERPDVFVSYSRKDAEFARRLGEALVARDKEVWADWEDIPATAEWRGEISAGIDAADSFAYVISPASVKSEECGKELAYALAQGKRIVPLLYKDANGLAIPPEIASRNWIFFRADDDFDQAVETFVEALETDLDWVRAHTRLLVRSREWEARKGERSLLLRGAELRDAEQWLTRIGPGVEPQPTPLQRELVLASRRAQTRRRGIALGAVAVTIVLGVVAWAQRSTAVDNEHIARSRQLATAASAQLEADPALSAVLSEEAVKQKATGEAEDALRRALSLSNVVAISDRFAGWVTSAAFSRDGKRLLTGSRDSTARMLDAATGRTLTTFRGHRNWIASAAFSPDGRRFVTASSDGTARIWDATGRGRPLVLRGHEGRVSRASFSPDGRTVLTGGLDATARIWDARTGKQLRSLRGHEKWVSRATFSPDGRLVATASDDGTARLWDARSGRTLRVLNGGGGVVLDVAFNPQGTLLATGSENGSVRLWRVQGSGRDGKLVGHSKVISSLAFSPDGARLATGSMDTTARIWDVATRKVLRILRGHSDIVTRVSFSPDGSLLATASGDGTARLWDEFGETVAEFRGHLNWLTTVTFSRDGTRLATASADGTARVWDPTRGFSRAVLRTEGTLVGTAEFSPDGRTIATGGVPGRIWSLPSWRPKGALLPGASRLAYFPGGHRLVVAAPLGQVAVYGVPAGRVVASAPAHDDGVNDVEVSPDGHLVASAGKDGTATISRAADGVIVATLDHDGPVNAVTFAPDSTVVATASDDKTARLWDARTGRERAVLRHAAKVHAVAFSPDGETIATGGGGESVRLWTSTGVPRATLWGHSRSIVALSFSADSRLLATASLDQTARVWSVDSGVVLTELRHPAAVVAVDFGPGGRFLVTGSWDRKARIWDVRSGREFLTLFGSKSLVLDVDFAPDGRSVVTAGVDDAARVYSCNVCGSLDDLLTFAKTHVRRELTADERALFLNPQQSP